MTCIENMPRIDTRARPDGYGPPTSGGEAPPQGGEPPPPGGDRQARQAVVEKQPTMLKLGTPPISGEIVDYICRY